MKRKQGFTLVELLVVIGIIALLISILLPALGRVKWQAQMTACGARQRDIVNAILMYANDNKGSIPPWPGDDGKGTYNVYDPAFTSSWNRQYQFSNLTASSTGTTGVLTLASTEKDDGAQLGRLWKTRYIKTAKVFWCPAIKYEVNANTPPKRDFGYYTYNPTYKYADSAATIVQVWWKKINRYGIASTGIKWKNGYTKADMTTPPPDWRRPILLDSVYEFDIGGDRGNVSHVLGNRRGYNLAYADGSVRNYVENNFMQRPGTSYTRFLNFTNALGAAADGLPITFATSEWSDNNNSPYYAIPVNP